MKRRQILKSSLLSRRARQRYLACFSLMLLLSPVVSLRGAAQIASPPQDDSAARSSETDTPNFRLERLPVAGGGELLTIFGDLEGLSRTQPAAADIPLVSVLRDTLNDADADNDRLRYVWMHTYTRPTLLQRAAAAIPFLYTRIGNQGRAGRGVPPPVIDLSRPEGDVWRNVFWTAMQSVLIDPFGMVAQASARAYRRNIDDYRRAHIIRALAILSLYEAEAGAAPTFTELEMREIQARLMLTERTFGGLIDDINLRRVYYRQTTQWRDTRGHNWELLRQAAENAGLYFEPLEMADGSATHAMLWIARSDLATERDRRYEGRFLSIANPWRDGRLRAWRGYTETRYFDAGHRQVAAGTPGARAVELIPLALYGLDHPRIPILLVDFRDGSNPARREMSRRALDDVARNLLALSGFGNLHYFLGRTIYDFVTERRGMDINQPSRLRAYSQLKLLLALNISLDPHLRNELSRRVERVSLNPLENGMRAEGELARAQYAALVAYARRADGLPARLERERREELVTHTHGRAERVLFRLGNILSLGLYTHRERAGPETAARLDLARRLDYHTRFLREVARSSPRVEVVWNIEEVRRSLRFIAAHGAQANNRTASAAARIFANTEDEETRRLCLNSLYRINNETAKRELVRIYQNEAVETRWRELSGEYLRRAVREEQRIAPADARTIGAAHGQ